jgi:hypothetical protein
MLTARIRRLLGRMEGKSQEGQAAHMGERIGRLRLRGHAPAEGLTARNQRQCRYQRVGRGNGGADGGVANGGRIGSPAALFHVRKLIAQCRDMNCRKIGRQAHHEGMQHARTGTMCHDETGFGLRRTAQDSGHARGCADIDVHGL